MTEPVDTSAAPGNARRTWADLAAGPMFFLALLFLVALAGLIHRYPRLGGGGPEVYRIGVGLGALWLVFLLEAALRFRLRDRGRPAWRPLLAAVACGLLPPLRLGCRGLARPDHVWLPVLGWREVDARLRHTLERFFSLPMIFFALLVLPLFALEYYWAEQVHAHPALALGLDVGAAAIWVAFTVELVLMVAVSDRPVRYCFLHWVDVAVVLLPVVEALPLLRLLRLGRGLRLEPLLRWGRLYRLRALAARGWRASLLLQAAQRLTGRSPEHRLQQLRELLQAREEELAELRREVEGLEARIARGAGGRAVALPSNGAQAGRPGGVHPV